MMTDSKYLRMAMVALWCVSVAFASRDEDDDDDGDFNPRGVFLIAIGLIMFIMGISFLCMGRAPARPDAWRPHRRAAHGACARRAFAPSAAGQRDGQQQRCRRWYVRVRDSKAGDAQGLTYAGNCDVEFPTGQLLVGEVDGSVIENALAH